MLQIDGFYLTTPLPGTPYWHLAMKQGLVSEDMDWDRLNLDIMKTVSFDFDRAIYLNSDLTPLSYVKETIQRFQEEFMFYSVAWAPKHVTVKAGKTAADLPVPL